METIVFDGKRRAAELEKSLAAEIAGLPRKPVVRDFGDLSNPEVRTYMESRRKRGDRLGVTVELRDVSRTPSADLFYSGLREASEDPDVTAIWIDRPLPFAADDERIFRILPPGKDGEGLHPENLGRLLRGEEHIVPATARAVIESLDSAGFPYEGSDAVVVGRSLIVGRPVALLLLHRHCSVTVCHSRSRGIAEATRRANLLVVAIGKPGFVTADWVRDGAFVVDVGTNYVDGKLVGDVNPEGLSGKAGWYTPVPGGIGAVTSVLAFDNIVRLSRGAEG
jgi:methylenetetrahydrofolate dehydrogenase (NADP+)/methenyltetrahydrofolate cyclohydrolase